VQRGLIEQGGDGLFASCVLIPAALLFLTIAFLILLQLGANSQCSGGLAGPCLQALP